MNLVSESLFGLTEESSQESNEPMTIALPNPSPPRRSGPLSTDWSRFVLSTMFLAASAVCGAEATKEPTLVAWPEAFESVLHPNCSHCVIEANRRKDELRSDDRVLGWM